jgi:protein TonB
VRRQKLPQIPEVARAPVTPAEVETSHRPVPRQPSGEWQQAPAPPQATAPGPEEPLAAYLAEVRAAIERHKYYPSSAQRVGVTGQVVLQFVILPDGRVSDPRILERNGHGALGSAALDALRRASPLPPFPETLTQERLLVKVPISYKLSERE